MAEPGSPAYPDRNVPGLTPELKQKIRGLFRALSWISPALAARLAARLFLTPRARRLSPEDQQFLASARRHQLHTARGPIQAYEWPASGPTVLVVHGWISHTARLADLIRALCERGLRVIGLDAPAHGLSPGRQADYYLFRDAIETVNRTLGPANCCVAHSFGALTTALWLADGASGCRRAVLVGTPRDAAYMFEAFCGATALRADVVERMRTLFQRRYGHAPEYYSVIEGAPRLRLPVLLVHGAADEFIPPEHSEQIAARLPDGQLLLVAGLNHSAPLRDPATIAHMTDFLASHVD